MDKHNTEISVGTKVRFKVDDNTTINLITIEHCKSKLFDTWICVDPNSGNGNPVCQRYNCFTDDLEIGWAATSQQITQCSKNDGLNMTKEEALEALNSECSDIFKVQSALKIARDTLAEAINKNQHLECGKEYSYPLANGTLHIDVSADNFYPGLDIEFVPDEFEGLAGTFPRFLLEAPIDSDTLELTDLRACIWARADSEDYTQCIYFEEKQLGHSVYSSTKQEDAESRAAHKKEEEYEIGL